MSPRNTKSGGVLEQMVQHALEQGKYKYVRGKKVGTRFGVTGHIIDTYAEDQRGRVHLISLKWQQVSGTAEQKVPFEVISLIDLASSRMRTTTRRTSYLVATGGSTRTSTSVAG